MRYIEMVGLPGAGKTSVRRGWRRHGRTLTMRELLERERVRTGREHRRHLVRVMPPAVTSRLMRGVTPSAADAARFAVMNPALHDLVWSRSRAVPDVTRRAVALALMWDAWADRGFAEHAGASDERLLLDEGVWQRLAYLLAASGVREPSDMPTLPHPMPPLDALVVMTVPVEVAASRALGRPHGFKEVDLLPAMEMILEHLVGALTAAGTPCLVIDGQRPVSQSRADVRRFLDQLP